MGVPARAVAIIPARGGSKGVPGKNLAVVGGRSLVRRAVAACLASEAVDEVVVSTDAEDIASEAARAGARVVPRPPELATDEASSESAVLHALEELRATGARPDVVVFVQATSPFIDPVALRRAVQRVAAGQRDVVFSAVATYDFIWRCDATGVATGVNHDAAVRPRRQDRDPDWRETGAFYVMDARGFVATRHRFFGRVGVEEVAEEDALEIDTPGQLSLARSLAAVRSRDGGGDELVDVGLLATDFDGVHTDDHVVVGQDGTEQVIANRADGHGVKLLREAGVPVLILSTETNPVVLRRAEKLRVECLHGLDDKWATLKRWLDEHGVDPATVAYVGNDVNDLDCLAQVGFPVAVADAHPAVVDAAVYVTSRCGGHGAVREVADRILAGRRTTTGQGAPPR
jgi:N-acylneuraminate cytidylyltransferase